MKQTKAKNKRNRDMISGFLSVGLLKTRRAMRGGAMRRFAPACFVFAGIALAFVFFVIPICVSGHCSKVSLSFSGQTAYAASSLSPAAGALDEMNKKEKQHYAVSLAGLVSENADSFLKLVGQDVQTIFSDPELVRKEGAVMTWQYRTESCVLDVYFNDADTMESANVIHYEMRSREEVGISRPASDKQINPTACLQALMRPKLQDKAFAIASLK